MRGHLCVMLVSSPSVRTDFIFRSSYRGEYWMHKWTLQWLCVCSLTVTPYLRAIPCRVSLSVTRCSMYFSPSEAVTLAVLPYERILVRAKLWDSSLSDSEPDLDRGKMGWPNRPPPSRIGRTGENSAIFSWINKRAPVFFVCFSAPVDSPQWSNSQIQAAERFPSPVTVGMSTRGIRGMFRGPLPHGSRLS